MQFIKAIPKDIHILVSISLVEIKHLDTILNNMVFNYDGTDPTHIAAKQYLEKGLSVFVSETLEELFDGDRPDTF